MTWGRLDAATIFGLRPLPVWTGVLQKVLNEGYLHSEHSVITVKHHNFILGPYRARNHQKKVICIRSLRPPPSPPWVLRKMPTYPLDPPIHNPKGRPSTTRLSGPSEGPARGGGASRAHQLLSRMQRNCSICHRPGHNRSNLVNYIMNKYSYHPPLNRTSNRVNRVLTQKRRGFTREGGS